MRFLRSTSFRWLWVSTLGFGAGQPLESTATAWLALQVGGPFTVGLALAARALPRVLFSLAGGAMADHVDRRRVILVAAVVGALVMTAIGWITGVVEVAAWHTVAFAFAGGCLPVLHLPARQALVPDTVEHAMAPNALAATSLSENLARAGGAVIAGLLIATFGTHASYFASALAYLFAALFLLPLRVTGSEHGDGVRTTFVHALRDAVRVVLDIPAIRTLALAAIAADVFAYSYISAVPAFVRDRLFAGPEALGLISASQFIGASVALVALSVIPSRIRREGMLGAVFAAFGVSLVAFGASPNVPVATAVAFIVGACGGAFDSLQQVLMQLAVPIGQRGRAASIWLASTGSGVFGHLETGALTTFFGAPIAMGLNGAIVVCAAALLLAVAPAHRPPRMPARTRLRRTDIVR